MMICPFAFTDKCSVERKNLEVSEFCNHAVPHEKNRKCNSTITSFAVEGKTKQMCPLCEEIPEVIFITKEEMLL